MTFTRCLDGIESKNPIARDHGWIHVELPTYPTPRTFVANWSDLELIAPHRWRLAGKRIVTTIEEDGIEVPISIENVLLKRPRRENIPHKNDDLYDVRRLNLTAPRVADVMPNTYTVKGSDAFLHLPCGTVVVFDREDLARVEPHRWIKVMADGIGGNRPLVKTLTVDDTGNKTNILLHRHILGIPGRGPQRIDFIDGDKLNFRKSNLNSQILNVRRKDQS